MTTSGRGYNQLSFFDKTLSAFLIVGLLMFQLWPTPAFNLTAGIFTPLPFYYYHITTFRGEASYYSREGCYGCNEERIMANGEPLQDHELTIAIGHQQQQLVGRLAKVTNPMNNKSVIVKITDTGTFDTSTYGNRVADVTVATKEALDLPSTGTITVEVFPF